MRILWFTNTPSCYAVDSKGYNGGGWISSLEEEIKKESHIELGICFQTSDKIGKTKKKNVTYYPIRQPFGLIKKTFTAFHTIDNLYLKEYLKVIEDYKPDIINIFGTENNFGLISLHTKVPAL